MAFSNYLSILCFLFLSVLFYSCTIGDNEIVDNGRISQDTSEWLIPAGEVLDGGPGKDGIPSVDNPVFDAIADINFLDDSDLVVGVVRNGIAKAYPHPILDWHEIVNDEIDGVPIALTYCPLTGTATAWDRTIDGDVTTFGVSGKLYNTNLIPYDRKTDSYWSQMRLDCVNGHLLEQVIDTYPVIETTWKSWREAYPESMVMNTETGFSRNYQSFPYGDYRTNNDNIIFPVSNRDTRLPAKERVMAVLADTGNSLMSIESFTTPGESQLDELLFVGSKEDNFLVVFENPANAQWTYIDNALPVIAEDTEGNRLTLSGTISSGPRQGEQLSSPKAYMGYFFAFGAFFPDIEIL